MHKLIILVTLMLFVISLAAAAEITSEEVQALQSREATGIPLTPAEKSQVEGYLTQKQLLYPNTDNSWGTDGWYSSADQYSGGQPYNWIDISSTGTDIWPGQDQDDTWSNGIRLPFSFPFYQMRKDSVYVSANVILKFNAASAPSYSTPIPSDTQPPRIDPWCFDMYHHGTDTVDASHYYYQSFGDSLFVVQFKNARYYTTPYRYDETYGKDLETLLYSDGRIVFQYGPLRTFIAGSPYNSGIDDSVSTAGLTCGSSFSQGQAITFTPLTGVILASGQVNPISGTTSTNFVYKVKYRNTVSLPPTSAQVYIDDVAYALMDSTGGAGNYFMGVNFYKTTTLPMGNHNFYFEFGYDGNTYRYPASGYLTGPTVYAPFSGSYDIGGGANNFPTIVAAVSALTGAGLSGPVTFNVYDGIYDGQVNLPYSIVGLSATNTLTIQAAPGAFPIIQNTTGTTSTTGNAFYITGADYITIKGFEIRNCYYAAAYVYYGATSADSSRYVTIENNNIHDIAPTTTGYGIYAYYAKYLSILNNKIQGDYYGIYLSYNSYGTVANNMVWGQDYYGVYNYYTTYTNYFYNTLYMSSAYATTNYAMYMYYATGCSLKDNIIENAGSGSTTKYAFYLTGTLSTYPITSDYNDLYAPNGGSVGYYNAAQATLAAWRTATALDAHSVSVNPGFVSTATPFDFHINTTVPSPVNGKATPVAVVVDYDYQARDATIPDVGADEFTPPAGVFLTNGQVTPPSGLTTTNFVYQILYTNSGSLAPISAQVYIDDVPYALMDSTGGSGNYANGVNFYRTTTLPGGTHNYYFEFQASLSRDTYRFPTSGYLTGPTVLSPFNGSYDIGGGANHYPTILAAAAALNVAGLSGPTVFNVYNGTYDGQVNLPYTIPGLSATNTLKFQAATGATPIVVNTAGTTSSNGNGFYITGADYITIKGFEIKNCYYSAVYVYYGTTSADSARYITIENNNIHDIAATTTGYSIYAYYPKYLTILNNKIQGDYGGIYLNYGSYGTVANNMVFGQDYYGIQNYACTYFNYFYNSVYMNSTYSTTNYASYFYNSTGCVLNNNSFFNGGSGSTTKYAIYLSGTLSTYPVTSNYNDLYAPSSSVGYYTAAQTTLAAWRTATGLDANSISANPNYVSIVSPYNLHINTSAASPVDGMATPTTPITVDFDYEARNFVTPDIGADEFTVPVYNVAISPASQSHSGNAGGDVDYYYSIGNTGNMPESFNLSTLGAAWATAIYDSAGTTQISVTPTLAVSGNYWVKVVHSIPGGTQGGSTDTGTLKAVPSHNPAVMATATFTTTVNTVLGVTITPESQSLAGNPGSAIDYFYYVHNGGNIPDAFDLATFGATWTTAIYDSAGTTLITATSTIPVGGSECVRVVHNIPGSALGGDVDTGYLSAVSTHGSTVADTSSFTSTALANVDVTLAPETLSGAANAGSSADYFYYVSNNGNVPDVFALATHGAAWGTAIYDSAGTTIITATSTIPVGGIEWVKVMHSVPDTALVGDSDTGYLTAISTHTRNLADTSSFTTTVPPSYGVEVTPETQQSNAIVGSQAAYYYYIHNVGGIPDAYNLATFGATWATAIYDSAGLNIITSTSTLPIGSGEWVKVVHSVPGSAHLGDSDTGYLQAVSSHDPATADTAAFTTSIPSGIFVTVAPESQNQIGSAGTDVAYFYYVQNGSSASDVCNLATFGASWATAIYDSAGTTIINATPPIAAGGSVWVKVVHSVPVEALGGNFDTGYLTATSTLTRAAADTAAFTTTVLENVAMLITPEAQVDTANTGITVYYDYYVVNAGNIIDSYVLWSSGASWPVTLYDATMSTVIDSIEGLQPGDSCKVVVAHAIPYLPPNPLVDTGYLGAVSISDPTVMDSSSFTTDAIIWPPVRIATTPDSSNIVITPGGGTFTYLLEVNNMVNQAFQTRVYNTIRLPNGSPLNLFTVNYLSQPGSARSRNMVQYVPASAPPGTYHYTFYVANTTTWQVLDSASFTFEKLAGDEPPAHYLGWKLDGWETLEELALLLPKEFDLHANFPNPFNPSTHLIYDLPEDANVTLYVYDIAGRRVAELVNGFQQAGVHQAIMNGVDLSSGIYFAVFKANDFCKVQKMVLMK